MPTTGELTEKAKKGSRKGNPFFGYAGDPKPPVRKRKPKPLRVTKKGKGLLGY